MFRRPGEQEVIECGRAVGIELTPIEARVLGACLAENIDSLEGFYESRIEEQRLPLRHFNRDPGYRPTAEEDPLNVFIRKCHVAGADSGPLHGKTVGLKDHISVAGVPLTFGSHFMDGYIPDFDATIVTRVLDAGATITGKLNMEDFSSSGPGVSGVGDYGRPLNPHNLAHLTGGSSSGSGAAVAGGYVDIAFGGDQGGSIRLPSAWCGIVGLIATQGLIPHTGVFGLDPTIDFTGPMARSVEDIATVMQCVAGPDGFDPRQVNLPAQLPNYNDALTRGVDGLRIGVLSEGFGIEGSEKEVEQAVMEAISVLESAGATAERVSVPLHRECFPPLMALFAEGGKHLIDTNLGGAFAKTYYPSSIMSVFGRMKKGNADELPPNIKFIMIFGQYLLENYSGRLYAKAQNVRPTYIEQYNRAFANVDLLAMPTIPVTAPKWREPKDYEEALEHTMIFGSKSGLNIGMVVSNTAPFNYTGFPAISVPCGKSNGLPIGMMLVAPYFREDVLFQASYAYEQSANLADLAPAPVAVAV